MASIEECVTQPNMIKFAFSDLSIDKSADKWTAKCKICKQKLVDKKKNNNLQIFDHVHSTSAAALVARFSDCVDA